MDDFAADRRVVVEVGFQRLTVSAQMLKGFDGKANRWSQYVGSPICGQLGNRRGEKALLAWITAKANEMSHYPNPGYSTFYSRSLMVAARPNTWPSIPGPPRERALHKGAMRTLTLGLMT